MPFSILNLADWVLSRFSVKNFSYRSTGTVEKMISIEEQSGMLNKGSKKDK